MAQTPTPLGDRLRHPAPQPLPSTAASHRRSVAPLPGWAPGAAAWPRAALDAGHLPRLLGTSLHHLLLAPGFRDGRYRPELGLDELPVPGPGGRLPHDRRPNRRHRAGGHADGHRPGDPDRLLRGAYRQPACAYPPVAFDGAAPLV